MNLGFFCNLISLFSIAANCLVLNKNDISRDEFILLSRIYSLRQINDLLCIFPNNFLEYYDFLTRGIESIF